MGECIMNDDNNLDLLDLDDSDAMDTLPDATPFAAPRPKKPWLLLGVGVLAVVLSSYIIIRVIGDEQSSAVEVDLDAPVAVVDMPAPVEMNVMPAAPVQVAPHPAPQPAPEVAKPQATVGVPVRVVEERKEVVFKPAAEEPVKAEPVKTVTKPVAKQTAKPVAKQAAKPVAKKVETKVADKPVAGAWYVQFGSYSSRAAAETAQRQIANAHKSLFTDKQFVILAAQLKDGKTTYRLRVAFKTAADANGFCRNAKSDGLDCYVAK